MRLFILRPFWSRLWVDYSPTHNDPLSFCLLITCDGSKTITSWNRAVTAALTSESWRKRPRWRSWRCPCQPALSWTPGNCWGSSAPSLWGKRRLWPHLERSRADLKIIERHLWVEKRRYAGDGAHAHTGIQHPTRFSARKYVKSGVFCLQVGVFPSAALLPMTYVIFGVRLVRQRLQPSQIQWQRK